MKKYIELNTEIIEAFNMNCGLTLCYLLSNLNKTIEYNTFPSQDLSMFLKLSYKQQLAVKKQLSNKGIINFIDNNTKYKINYDKLDCIISGEYKISDNINNAFDKINNTIDNMGGEKKLKSSKHTIGVLIGEIFTMFGNSFPLDSRNAKAINDSLLKSKLATYINTDTYEVVQELAKYSIDQYRNLDDIYRIMVTNPFDFVDKYMKIKDRFYREKAKQNNTQQNTMFVV